MGFLQPHGAGFGRLCIPTKQYLGLVLFGFGKPGVAAVCLPYADSLMEKQQIGVTKDFVWGSASLIVFCPLLSGSGITSW